MISTCSDDCEDHVAWLTECMLLKQYVSISPAEMGNLEHVRADEMGLWGQNKVMVFSAAVQYGDMCCHFFHAFRESGQ